jgi:hypothetical protein
MAPWGRAGQWSLRLPCAAPGRHASWGRLSSEGLGGTRGGTALIVKRSEGTALPCWHRASGGGTPPPRPAQQPERLAWQGAAK